MAHTPEDFAQLHERFAKILGRQPTSTETKELMADKDEMGLSYHDPLLVQLMAFKRERLALGDLFRAFQEDCVGQLGELRQQVLRETDQALAAKTQDAIQRSEKQMYTEMQRILELHRTALTAEVKVATENAVKEKFKETWIREWQTEFTKDWKEQINPAYTKLREALEKTRTWHWRWIAGSLIISFLAGIALAFWSIRRSVPPADAGNRTAPVKTTTPFRK
jgi:hypothetical protein